MESQLYIGALNLSPYVTECNNADPNRVAICCYRVPEAFIRGIDYKLNFPLYCRFIQKNAEIDTYVGYPQSVVFADFSFSLWPYIELTFRFQNRAGLSVHHIRVRLYLAGEAQ